MYYVAKTYNYSTPSIVELFNDEELAHAYAKVMNAAGKGKYIVLKPVES